MTAQSYSVCIQDARSSNWATRSDTVVQKLAVCNPVPRAVGESIELFYRLYLL
jgi:hypothetical protein